jgi:hypothetical protein
VVEAWVSFVRLEPAAVVSENAAEVIAATAPWTSELVAQQPGDLDVSVEHVGSIGPVVNRECAITITNTCYNASAHGDSLHHKSSLPQSGGRPGL